MESWLALLVVALFALTNLVIAVLLVNASAKARAGPKRRPEDEMAAFLEEQLRFARSLREPNGEDARRPDEPGGSAERTEG